MRVLIVSPHFPPSNAADMQRVRLILPYLGDSGVEAQVLAVEPEHVAAPQDEWLAAGLPSNVPVHRVKAFGLQWGRIPGFGTLPFRALGALRKKGDDLLEKGLYDLVYFSTTQFGLHLLGPRWKRNFGVPFVMDYQDPWVNDYYRDHPEVRPPGGKFKYSISDWINRRQEPPVLRECSGITSVSAAYPDQLTRRYPWLSIQGTGNGNRDASQISSPPFRSRTPASCSPSLHPLPSLILPFPGDARDFVRVKREGVKQNVFDPCDGLKHWVYVGRGGEDMAFAVRAIFSALSDLRPKISDLRLHFIGTSYAAAGQGVKTIEPLADAFGLASIVTEHPDRIPYSETLRCLLDADVLMIPGSDDSGYTASKIYPYLLAGRPLLAVFHEKSPVISLLQKVGGGHCVTFQSGEAPEVVASRISSILGFESLEIPEIPLDPDAFSPNTAKVQSAQLSQFWDHCLKGAKFS